MWCKLTDEQLNSHIPSELNYNNYDPTMKFKDVILGYPLWYNGEVYYNCLLITNFITGNCDHELSEEEFLKWKKYTNNNLYIYNYNMELENEEMIKYE